jgi:RNase P subunit RPR2
MSRPSDEKIIAAAKAVIQRWDSPLWRQEVGTADLINTLREAVDNHEKVITSQERVQIPAEVERGYCPLCTGNVWKGRYCNGPNCPLRPTKETPDAD